MDFKYPQWQTPLEAAVLALNSKKFREKTRAAQVAIGTRICELALVKDSRDELLALAVGTAIIRDIKRLRRRSPSE